MLLRAKCDCFELNEKLAGTDYEETIVSLDNLFVMHFFQHY